MIDHVALAACHVSRDATAIQRAYKQRDKEQMQRLIEQPSSEGTVLEGKHRRGRVHYHLAVYQHFADENGERVPENLEVEGRVTALGRFDIGRFQRSGVELTLRLADGRLLDFRIVGEDGTIHSTARGLYKIR